MLNMNRDLKAVADGLLLIDPLLDHYITPIVEKWEASKDPRELEMCWTYLANVLSLYAGPSHPRFDELVSTFRGLKHYTGKPVPSEVAEMCAMKMLEASVPHIPDGWPRVIILLASRPEFEGDQPVEVVVASTLDPVSVYKLLEAQVNEYHRHNPYPSTPDEEANW